MYVVNRDCAFCTTGQTILLKTDGAFNMMAFKHDVCALTSPDSTAASATSFYYLPLAANTNYYLRVQTTIFH